MGGGGGGGGGRGREMGDWIGDVWGVGGGGGKWGILHVENILQKYKMQ